MVSQPFRNFDVEDLLEGRWGKLLSLIEQTPRATAIFERWNFLAQGYLGLRLEISSGAKQRTDRGETRRGESAGIWDEGMRQAEPQEQH